MIVKGKDFSGSSNGWLKKANNKTINLEKENGYYLTSAFHNPDESIVIEKDEYFITDSGRRGTRRLFNWKGKEISDEEINKIIENANYNEKIIVKTKNSILFRFGAYIIAKAKDFKPDNPLSGFTAEQLVKELRDRGHDVKLDDQIEFKSEKMEYDFRRLDMEE